MPDKPNADRPTMCIRCANHTPVTETTGTCSVYGPITAAIVQQCKDERSRVVLNPPPQL